MSFFNTPWKFHSLPLKNRANSPEGKYFFVGTDEKEISAVSSPLELVLGRKPVLHGCTGRNLIYPKHDVFSENVSHLPQISGWNFQKYLSCHHLDLRLPNIHGAIYPQQPQKNQNARLQRPKVTGKRDGKAPWQWKKSDHSKMYLLRFFGKISMIFPVQVRVFRIFSGGLYVTDLSKKSPIPSHHLPWWFLRISGLHPTCHPWQRITRAPVGGTT